MRLFRWSWLLSVETVGFQVRGVGGGGTESVCSRRYHWSFLLIRIICDDRWSVLSLGAAGDQHQTSWLSVVFLTSVLEASPDPSAFSVKLLLLNPLQRVTFSKLELFHMKGEHTCGGFFQFCGITFRSNFRNDFPSLGMAAHRHIFPLNTLFISSYWVFLMRNKKKKSLFFSLQLKWSQKWTPVTHILAHLVKTFMRLVSIGCLSVNNGRSPCLLALLGKAWAFFLILILFATYNCSESNQENTKYWFLHGRD